MALKDVLTLAKRLPGVQYLKYLDPYYPAQRWADNGKKHLAILYFFSWYVIGGVLIKMKMGKKEEPKQQ